MKHREKGIKTNPKVMRLKVKRDGEVTAAAMTAGLGAESGLHQHVEDSLLPRCTLNRVPHAPAAREARWPQMASLLPPVHKRSRSLWERAAQQQSHTDVTVGFITLSRCTPADLWLTDRLTQVQCLRATDLGRYKSKVPRVIADAHRGGKGTKPLLLFFIFRLILYKNMTWR